MTPRILPSGALGLPEDSPPSVVAATCGRVAMGSTFVNGLCSGRNWQLFSIIIVASTLRLWGLDFGLPFLYHPDEPNVAGIALNMFQTGDLNPHFFHYPSLAYYLNALAYVPYFLAGRLLGVLGSLSDIPPLEVVGLGVGRSLMPTQLVLGRGLTTAVGVFTVLLVYFVGARVGNRRVGLLSATLLAISPTHVSNSHFITTDAFVTFFVLLSFLFSCQILLKGNFRFYVLAGVAAGLAMSCKYNGGLVLLPLFVAHFLRSGLRGVGRKEFYIAVCLSGLAFVLTTPYSVLDWHGFVEGVRFDAQHYSSGHAGMEGDALRWYLHYLLRFEGLVAPLALAQCLVAIRARRRIELLVVVYAGAYLALISSFVVRNDRTLLPALPFVVILAALLLDHLIVCAATMPFSVRRHLSRGLLLAATGVVLAWPLSSAAVSNARLSNVDGRELARVWINSQIRQGSRIAAESYSPFLDPAQFEVKYVSRIIDEEPDWYRINGFEYLVFSQGMYGRFFREPNRYQLEVSSYDSFFKTFTEIARFNANEYEVRVLRVDN